ncbi:SDR family oxidoreductase [Candidatus Binatia bacterium]|nr:SDR family oxidoreductase [Candidatus Binatia bacterium]
MQDLAGKYAFITGASRGIGRAAALALAARGATVAIGYRKEAETAVALAAELEKAGGGGFPVQLDVGDAEQREAAFDRVAERFGALDVYVANAAATAFKPLLDVKPHHVQKTFAITVDGFLFGVQRAARLMEGRTGASIVAVSGYDCVRTVPRHGVLGAAKAAMEMLARHFAFELGPRGIRVNCVNFVYADTDSTRFFAGEGHDALQDDMRALTPLRGLATADDVAGAIAYLCSDGARFVSGQTIMVDGGVLLTSPAPAHLPPIDS